MLLYKMKKIAPDVTHSDKVGEILARLLNNCKEYSLSELSNSLQCSKQTVRRIIDSLSAHIPISCITKGKQLYFRVEKPLLTQAVFKQPVAKDQKAIAYKVRLTEKSGKTVLERKLAPDQQVIVEADGNYLVTFSALLEEEVLGWILSNGLEARLLSPPAAITNLKIIINNLQQRYQLADGLDD